MLVSGTGTPSNVVLILADDLDFGFVTYDFGER
jgi:hypothetical protein